MKAVRIGACQTPEFIADPAAALNCLRQFARAAEADQVDLLVFPECFLQGYIITPEHLERFALDLASPECEQLLSGLKSVRPTLVFGIIEKKGEEYFNSAVVVTRGLLTGVYRKTYLVPGESLFTPGIQYPVFDLKGLKYGINICYDAQFPAAARAVANQGARVILHPAQNMMRRQNAELWKHRHNEIRAQRTRETGLWMVSADVTGARDDQRVAYGPTCILNPQGEVAAQVPLMTVGMATVDIPVAIYTHKQHNM